MTGFLDTNILVHAFEAGSPFSASAQALIGPDNRIGVQTLNEFALVCRRTLKMSWADVRRTATTVRGLCVEPPIALTLDIHLRGLQLVERYKLAFYDSVHVAAAIESNCTIFWSEDMHNALVIDGKLTIRNPFAP